MSQDGQRNRFKVQLAGLTLLVAAVAAFSMAATQIVAAHFWLRPRAGS